VLSNKHIPIVITPNNQAFFVFYKGTSFQEETLAKVISSILPADYSISTIDNSNISMPVDSSNTSYWLDNYKTLDAGE
jgi:hypothetical protein